METPRIFMAIIRSTTLTEEISADLALALSREAALLCIRVNVIKGRFHKIAFLPLPPCSRLRGNFVPLSNSRGIHPVYRRVNSCVASAVN